jgi:hypothetical protein
MAALAVFGAMAVCAQPPQHRGPGPLGALLAPHGHARPAPETPLSTPPVYFDATTMGSPLELDKNWRVGITANAAAAQPDFDDSTWAVRNAAEVIAEVNDSDYVEGEGPPPGAEGKPPEGGPPRANHQRPWAWFRLHIRLAPGHGPAGLLVELPVSQNASVSVGSQTFPVEVYANGNEVHPDGPHGDNPERFQPISRIYNLNVPADQTSLVLVVRTIYVREGFGSYTTFFSNRKLQLGNPDQLGHSLELWSVHSLFERLPRVIYSLLVLVLAFFLLVLFFAQKGHPEYLWLALHEALQAPLAFVDLAGSSAQLEQLWYAASVIEIVAISSYLYFEFLVAFLDLGHRWANKRKRWFVRLLRYSAPALLGLGPTLLLVGHSTFMAILLALVYLTSFFWFVGWLLFCFITLIAATVRRNFEAGLLLIPLILTIVGVIEPMLTGGMNLWTGHPYRSPLTIQAGPIPIHFAAIADFAGLLVIVIIIFVRFLRINRDSERASSELAAARSVQELLIPQERIKTPGFEVDSIYNPAAEVGGDFYHVESTPDGGLLVVIGDVAGKGLKAAMNVSMLMGALRRTPDRRPGKILESLNRVLVGSESFTTCQAAWFGPNGELTISNAGHLPVYLNSQEIFLPGSLPLGVVPEVTYEEIQLYLHAGDRLLLMSDGVVEARQSSGELFGFERVHNLSNQSAFYIADAARAFGQEDDITVVTVRRLEAAAQAA